MPPPGPYHVTQPGDRLRTILMFVGLLIAGSAHAGTVKLKAADNVAISGVESGTGAKGVVLIHGDGRSAADWANFATKLASQGFHVVALDLRGHGASPQPAPLTDADWPKMVADVDAAAAYLRTKGAKEIVLVGADVGASLALNAAAKDPGITSVVMLSPTVTAHGVKVSDALATYGQRPLMLVAATGDTMSAKAASLLEPKAMGPKTLQLLEGSGSGVQLLNIDAGLQGTLIGWLNGSWRVSVAPKPEDKLKTGTVQDINSTGTRLEDHK